MTIIKIEAHPKQGDLVVVHAGPDAAALMGRFQPARWQPKTRTYWLPTSHLDAFTRYLDHEDATLVDERGTGGAVGPLPECTGCGQPARRGVELRYCPTCGEPWAPVVHAAEHMPGGIRTTCLRCCREQHGRLTRCGNCGELMPPPATSAPRPVITGPVHTHLDEPVSVGQVLDDQQLPLDAQEATP